ncbi:MAG: hypothetical protein P8Y27_10850 [Chromatiaceae bacterium]|jgi:hypothetical protein
MDLLLILTYTASCIFLFKAFKIPLNKQTVVRSAASRAWISEHWM